MGSRSFGISTHLCHAQRLGRDHLIEMAAHGFDAVEVFATRTHFDYHNESAIADLQQWLAEAGLTLHSVHAPIAESFVAGRWGAALTLAGADGDARARALEEAVAALHVARRIPMQALVVHAGLAKGTGVGLNPSDSRPLETRDAARRSIEALAREAGPLGVRVAVEVIPNELSRAGSLVHFVEEDLDADGVGVCLDFGHAHMEGDLIDAIETVSGHLIAAHLHDNRGRTDDHLPPFDGTIDWPSALTAVQKIGYDGAFIFEVTAQGSTKQTLDRARRARERMERFMADG